MPTIEEYQHAMMAAHQAGDTDNARKMAQEVARLQSDPTSNMSGFEKFAAGAGKAVYDVGRGVGNIVTDISPSAAKYGFATRADTEAAKKLDAPLMDTGAGVAGNVLGNVLSMAPLAVVPGANTILGGAALGALTGAAQPVGNEDSRGTNALMGGAFGGAIPAAMRAGGVAKAAFIDPITTKGREKILAGMLRRSAANPEDAAAKLAVAKGFTPGFVPSVGQASGDAGLAAVERGLRGSTPAAFGDLEKSQRVALLDSLRAIAGTPEARSAQVEKVNETAKKLYGQAFKENMPVTPELSALARRPSMKAAETRAQKLAAELGAQRRMTLDDLNTRTIGTDARMPQPSSVMADVELRPATSVAVEPRRVPSSTVETPAERFNPYSNVAPQPAKTMTSGPGNIIPGSGRVDVPAARGLRQLDIPAEYPIAGSGSMDIPALDSVPVKDMHTIKMGMDALMGDRTLGIAGQEATAINRTRNAFVDQFPESYQTARQAHIDLNRPINQMDIGQELLNRYEPALSRASDTPLESRAASFAQALRGGDVLAKNVTGLKNAKLRSIMSPEQMATLEGVAKDSAMIKAGNDLGRGAGSNTMQNMSMQHLAAEAGVPNWLSAVASSPPGMMKKLADVLYKNSDDAVRGQMAEVMTNPEIAARLMQQAGPTRSKLAELLRASAQTGMLALPPIMNAN